MTGASDEQETQREGLRQSLQAELERAISDAGFSKDQVAFWIAHQTPLEIRDRGAMYFRPVQDPDPPYALTAEQYAEAISPELRDRHRVIVHLDYAVPPGLSPLATRALFGAMLRHELEHARQAEAPGGDAALLIDQELIDPVLSRKVGGLAGGAVFYSFKPIEMDANAASASYVRQYYPAVVDELLGCPCANLVRSNTGPERVDTLPRRTVCFLFQFRSIAEALVAPSKVDLHLRTYSDDAADVWSELAAS